MPWGATLVWDDGSRQNPPVVILDPGQTVSTYEILAPLGAGGMGEVFKARDRNLGREVAIKVLPESVSSDPERVLRFEREARVLASLDHPNIGAIFGFEKAEVDGVTIRFLVLEYIEGESLKDRVDRGPLPIEETLEVIKQVAFALESAHEKGIVHRDLKPANVQLKKAGQLTDSGSVKALDFGLARAMQPAGPARRSERCSRRLEASDRRGPTGTPRSV